MRATFEEKTYENYFNSELAQQTDVFFPLGQVQEGCLGFDCSALSINRTLWNKLGYPFWTFPKFIGLELKDIADEMEQFLGVKIAHIPKIKINLLFQYKKPEYLTTANSSEWTHWNKPYYRYEIYKKQQDLLMHIDKQFGTKILIVYASPALHDVNELVDASINKQIINISNFCKASSLNTHSVNTYIKQGTHSIACSEPEIIENLNLIESIGNFNNDTKQRPETNREVIIDFSKQIESIMNENQYYSLSFQKLNELYSEFKKYELLYSHIILSNFRLLTGTQWLAKI